MMSEKMADAINVQINAELYSAYLYLSMQTWFDAAGLPGCARWMRAQAKEEGTHTDRLWRIMVDRGARVTLTAIDAPETEWASPLAVFEAVYAHEQKVTGLINALVAVAVAERDLIVQALRKNNWNQTRAARSLGISRDNLRYRVKKYGIEIAR